MTLRASAFSLAVLCALAAAAPAQAGPKEVLAESFGKAFGKGGFRAETTVDVDGKPYVTRMDVQWPDRFHMKTPDTEMIILPGATWMNAGGQWMNMPMDMSKMIQGFSKQSVDEGVASLDQVEEIGSETIRGCDSTLYSYTTRGKFMGAESDSQAEIAICSTTGYPIRLVSRDKGGQVQATVHYDFETAIDVRAPQ